MQEQDQDQAKPKDPEQQRHDQVLKNLEQRAWTDRFVIGDFVDIQGYSFKISKLKQLRGELTLQLVGPVVRKGMSSPDKK